MCTHRYKSPHIHVHATNTDTTIQKENKFIQLGMVVHAFNLRTLEVEAGKLV